MDHHADLPEAQAGTVQRLVVVEREMWSTSTGADASRVVHVGTLDL